MNVVYLHKLVEDSPQLKCAWHEQVQCKDCDDFRQDEADTDLTQMEEANG